MADLAVDPKVMGSHSSIIFHGFVGAEGRGRGAVEAAATQMQATSCQQVQARMCASMWAAAQLVATTCCKVEELLRLRARRCCG